MKKELVLDLNQDNQVSVVTQALSSEVRRKIMQLLRKGSYTINEISCILNQPLSTTSFHISLLKKAQLININATRGIHGSAKVVSRKFDRVTFDMDDMSEQVEQEMNSISLEIPVGSYTDCKASNICGIASDTEIIGVDDMPSAFYLPERVNAGIVWFSEGYVEYRIPNYYLYGHRAQIINISFELCSEAPNFNMDWPSDITLWLNGKEICTYTSKGDFGDRRGHLTPSWWSSFSTQYGLLKTFKVDGYGVYIDENQINELPIDELNLESDTHFTLRIGIKDDAKNKGGLNIFGKTFGDYAQDIIVRIDYI